MNLKDTHNAGAKTLAAFLKRLIAIEAEKEFDMKAWSKKQKEVFDFLKNEKCLANSLGEEVWHFLSDIDIRKKEDVYSSCQTDFILCYIDELEAA